MEPRNASWIWGGYWANVDTNHVITIQPREKFVLSSGWCKQDWNRFLPPPKHYYYTTLRRSIWYLISYCSGLSKDLCEISWSVFSSTISLQSTFQGTPTQFTMLCCDFADQLVVIYYPNRPPRLLESSKKLAKQVKQLETYDPLVPELAEHLDEFPPLKMGYFCHTWFNLGISAVLEILQTCKLDHKVAWLSTWLPPTHPPNHPPTQPPNHQPLGQKSYLKESNTSWMSKMFLDSVRKIFGRCLTSVCRV